MPHKLYRSPDRNVPLLQQQRYTLLYVPPTFSQSTRRTTISGLARLRTTNGYFPDSRTSTVLSATPWTLILLRLVPSPDWREVVRIEIVCGDLGTRNHFTIFARILFLDTAVEELRLVKHQKDVQMSHVHIFPTRQYYTWN